jgi:hypothetical protein
MQKTLQSIAQVSFIFFALLGITHIASSFLIAQSEVNKMDWLAFQTLDLPFLFMGLLYGSSKLSLSLGNIFGSEKIAFIILSSLSIVIFLGVLYVNFIFPDAKLV